MASGERVPNGATLQVGIGAIPNAVLAALSGHDHLGLHTELLTKVWGPEYRDDLQYLRVWVSRVRRKLGAAAGEPGRIRTFQGIGYLLDVEPARVDQRGRCPGEVALHRLEAQPAQHPQLLGRGSLRRQVRIELVGVRLACRDDGVE